MGKQPVLGCGVPPVQSRQSMRPPGCVRPASRMQSALRKRGARVAQQRGVHVAIGRIGTSHFLDVRRTFTRAHAHLRVHFSATSPPRGQKGDFFLAHVRRGGSRGGGTTAHEGTALLPPLELVLECRFAAIQAHANAAAVAHDAQRHGGAVAAG